MSNAIDDFLIRLGFDTSAIKKELGDLHRTIEGVEKKAIKRKTWANLNAAEKEAKIKQEIAERTEKQNIRKRQQLQKAEMNAHVVAFQKQQNKISNLSKKSEMDVWAFRRKQAVDTLTSKDKNPQLKAMANYYKNLETGEKRRAQIQARWDKRRLARQVAQQQALAQTQRQQRFGVLARDASSIARSRGMDSGLTSAFGSRITGAGSAEEARRYAEALRQVSTRLNALDSARRGKLLNILREGDVSRLVLFNRELGRTSNEMNKARRSAIGLNAAQNSLHDSTRNMVRQYASLYAIFAGTGAIKRQAMAMDGAQAGLVAVTGSAEEAAHSLEFIKRTALQNGLAIADAAKDYVKFKAAIGDNHTLKETEEMFTDLTKAGVVFQLSQDDMKGIIRATQQMFSKQKITAEEFNSRFLVQ